MDRLVLLLVLLVILVIPGLGVSSCLFAGIPRILYSLVVAGAAIVDELVLLLIVLVVPGISVSVSMLLGLGMLGSLTCCSPSGRS